jgi:ubiquinone/menaquinone biosynthesis C-methylase UbiE
MAELELPQSSLRVPNGIDNVVAMRRRRLLNDFAEQPVDFIYMGLMKAQERLDLTANDIICDVGSSDGEATVRAAHALEVPAFIIGIDPSKNAHANYRRLRSSLDMARFVLLEGHSEDMVLPDNAARVTMAHNSLFRSSNVRKTLREFKRITEPDGLIIISTNAREHASNRHMLERLVAIETSRRTGLFVNRLRPPAEGAYWEDLPRLLQASGNFEVLDTAEQPTQVSSTPGERLEALAESLQDTFVASGLPEDAREDWDNAVTTVINRFVRPQIERQEGRRRHGRPSVEPRYLDRVLRGMVVLRNR